MSGELYFVVDGFAGAAGSYEFCVRALPLLPPACEVVTPLPCVAGNLAGNTCDADNFIDDLDCALYTHSGSEHWYGVTIDPGGALTAEVTLPTGDCALLLLGSCEPEYTCLQYADDRQTGEAETISWYNFTDSETTVYLVVDAWAPAQPCGEYVGSYACTGGGQSGMVFSWGNLKGTYR